MDVLSTELRVRRIPVFSTLPDHVLEVICHNAEIECYEERAEVFHKGDICDAWYVVVCGSISLYDEHEDENLDGEDGNTPLIPEPSRVLTRNALLRSEGFNRRISMKRTSVKRNSMR